MKSEKSEHTIITDVGSTTTKALLLSKKGQAYTIRAQYEVPTTVEKPFEDVKIGVISAIKELEKAAKLKLLDSKGKMLYPYLTTSSAGGGLQMLVFGLSAVETGRAAQMTAYGAGAVILKTLTIDDLIPLVEKMRLIRDLHPDIVLMAGGVDNGAISGVVSLAEILTLAEPEPKFRQSEKIPLVFCGNVQAQKFVLKVLAERFDVYVTPNIRPSMKELNTEPAKRKVHELFMENVMERAPGYAGLKKWAASDIIPTPAGVERILKLYAEKKSENILAVDIGGATTDIFSNIMGEYHRTVAANIGVSYSLSNILAEAGIERILQHLPSFYTQTDVRNYITNKTLNPTYVPVNDCERFVEQAAAIEGIRIAWKQHKDMNFKLAKMGRLDRRKLRKDVDPFEELFFLKEQVYFQPKDIDVIVGAGGILSHVKSKDEALWILAEGFLPSGVTKLALDSNFKSPHLGVLSKLEPTLALDLYSSECLEEIGYVIAPVGKLKPNKVALTVTDRDGERYELKAGDVLYLDRPGELEITASKDVCLASRIGNMRLKTKLGVLIDCRGRGEGMLDASLASQGIWDFFPSGPFKTKVQKGASQIVRGEYAIERKLPYEGEIFVRTGEKVAPDTVIGENRFGPPKLYLLDIRRMISYSTHITDEEVREGILVKVGDRVTYEQPIFKGEGKLLHVPYFIHSPVRGTVTQVEPSGLIILREIQDYDGKPHVVDVAKATGESPSHIKSYLKVSLGDFVEKENVIAKNISNGVFVKSPATGTVKEIDTQKGTVTIQYDLAPISTKSFVAGKISKVRPGSGVQIKGSGTILYAIIGFGREASGRLSILKVPSALERSHKSAVVVSLKYIDEAFLRKAAEVEVAGVIAPSLDNQDWVRFYGSEMGVALTGDEQVPFALILTEGFGRIDMNAKYAKFFEKAEGKQASVSARTQIRAGVTRPMVIVTQ